jgi:hypothetical protein
MGPEEATSIGLKEVGDGGFCADNRMSLYAGVTQLVEYLLPKQDAAGSSPVARSIISPLSSYFRLRTGRVLGSQSTR